jgi:hypothetical protein
MKFSGFCGTRRLDTFKKKFQHWTILEPYQGSYYIQMFFFKDYFKLFLLEFISIDAQMRPNVRHRRIIITTASNELLLTSNSQNEQAK